MEVEGQGSGGQSCNDDDNEAEAMTTTTMDCMVSCAFEQISARYLQISADICRYLPR